MKLKLYFACIIASALSGCAVSAQFSPVEGPLAELNPVPVFRGAVSGAVQSGSVHVVLDNNDSCEGHWNNVSGQARPFAQSEVDISKKIIADWDQIYGPNFYSSRVLGAQLYAKVILTCVSGRILHGEFFNERNVRGQTRGVAEDNLDNVFKINVYN